MNAPGVTADSGRRWQDWMTLAGVLVLLLLALPLLAAGLWLARAALVVAALAALTFGAVLFAVSARFRESVAGMLDEEVEYKGLGLATDVSLSPAHAWARVSGDQAIVGVDTLAVAALGPVDAVDLPEPGEEVVRGEPLFTIRHGARAVVARAPVSGYVTAVNDALRGDPARVSASPYVGGWVAQVTGRAVPRDRRLLLRGREARQWFWSEVDRLTAAAMHAQPAAAMADGGQVVGGLHEHIAATEWDRLHESFFARSFFEGVDPAADRR